MDKMEAEEVVDIFEAYDELLNANRIKDKLIAEQEKALAICESKYRKADKQIAEDEVILKLLNEMVEHKDKQIAELVDMLNVIWEDWSCDDCPEGEKMEELILKYRKGEMYGLQRREPKR
jgi:hypothetical protein